MREILFRGKKHSDGQWILGDLNQWLEAIYISAENSDGYTKTNWLVDAETVGQYTGVTANGTKIFEGDICRLSRVGTVAYGEITFKNGGYWFVDNDFGGLMRLCDCKTNGFSIEIIGNIHDNPEMLKGGANNGKL